MKPCYKTDPDGLPFPSPGIKLRSYCPEGYDDRVTIEGLQNGYAHCKYWGRCDAAVTPADLAKLFTHPQFGSRELKIWLDGDVTRFSIIRHND